MTRPTTASATRNVAVATPTMSPSLLLLTSTATAPTIVVMVASATTATAARPRAGQDLPPHRLGSSALEVEVEEQPPPLPLGQSRHDRLGDLKGQTRPDLVGVLVHPGVEPHRDRLADAVDGNHPVRELVLVDALLQPLPGPAGRDPAPVDRAA